MEVRTGKTELLKSIAKYFLLNGKDENIDFFCINQNTVKKTMEDMKIVNRV